MENHDTNELNSEELHEIVTAVPGWILRRGIGTVFIVLLSIFMMSAFIQYPDVVRAALKINSLNSPKGVYAKQTGKIVKILIKEGTIVKQDQPLAFMESTADHDDVLRLHDILMSIMSKVSKDVVLRISIPSDLNLGELQADYQTFYQEYLQYASTENGGYYLNTKDYLNRDLARIEKLKSQLVIQRQNQQKEYNNIEQEYKAYQKLYQKKVISNSEYKSQENKYLSGQYPLQQTTTALLNNSTEYMAKRKEILNLDHTISESKAKFVQALSSMFTQTNFWLNSYVLRAPIAGKVSYAGIVQENQNAVQNQEIFIINPSNMDFFGELEIPQYNMGKIRKGELTLVKMRSYPFEQFGLIRGNIDYISEVAIKDSVFIAKINLKKIENKDPNHKIILKNGMMADAEIITEKSSLLRRFLTNISKMLASNDSV